jgi:hypothetical protein
MDMDWVFLAVNFCTIVKNKKIFVLYSLFGKTFTKFQKKEKIPTHFDPDFGLVAFKLYFFHWSFIAKPLFKC